MSRLMFRSSEMKFAICYLNDGKMVALAAFVTVGMAKEVAKYMHDSILKDSSVLTGKPIPVLYVFDNEGRNYGSF